MQISRIEAFNPNRINWQMLTARQIIKYQERGVEVPDVYLQWAQNFLNNVNSADNDDITYEKAMNVQNVQSDSETQSENVEETQNNVEGDENIVSSDESDIDNPEENVQLSPAQQLHQQMNNEGVSLYDQARTFRRTSKSLSREAHWNSVSLKGMESSSEDEIESLEAHMKSLLRMAEESQNELNKEIGKINNGGDKYSYRKIMDMQRRLEQYGSKGQSEVALTTGKLDGIDMNINADAVVFPEAIDFGNEAISIGNQLVHDEFFGVGLFLGVSTIVAGYKAANRGDFGESVKQEALSINNSNISDAYALSSDIQSKTGVEALHQSGTEKDENNTDNSDPAKEREKNSEDPSLREEEIYKADSSSKASLDEILKRKIRRGEATEDVNS